MEAIFTGDMFNFCLNILFSVIFSFIIGLERELTGHKGSIKVNILIALGSCLFASYECLMGIEDNRISANILTGVGFLCSGFIVKNGLNVNGLSTAATLWCSAGIGMMTSRGFLIEAFAVTIFLFVLNFILSKSVTKIRPFKSFDDSKTDVLYETNIVCLKKSAKDVKKRIIANISAIPEATLEELIVKTITEDKVRVVSTVKVENEDSEKMENIISEIDVIKGVLSSGWSKSE